MGGNPDVSSRWFIAVQLPSDFSIWVGTNCANNCSNGEHGDCICSDGDYCTNVAGNGSYSAFYELPKTLQDSAGACSCSKDKYSFSFDCTQKNNGNSALYCYWWSYRSWCCYWCSNLLLHCKQKSKGY